MGVRREWIRWVSCDSLSRRGARGDAGAFMLTRLTGWAPAAQPTDEPERAPATTHVTLLDKRTWIRMRPCHRDTVCHGAAALFVSYRLRSHRYTRSHVRTRARIRHFVVVFLLPGWQLYLYARTAGRHTGHACAEPPVPVRCETCRFCIIGLKFRSESHYCPSIRTDTYNGDVNHVPLGGKIYFAIMYCRQCR
jgi:hypothetical protein